MSQLKISIITTSFNAVENLKRATKSVQEQQYGEFEHIIIDCGSTDSTIEFLKSESDLIWISEPYKKQSEAFNKGFEMASGDIIVNLNATDYFLPGAFENVVPYFERGHKIVLGNILVKQEWDGFEWLNSAKSSFNEMVRHWEANAFCTSPCGYFFTKEVQDQTPFNPDIPGKTDLEFLLETSLKYEIIKIDYTLGVSALSNNYKKKQEQLTPKYWNIENWDFIEKLAEKNLEQREFRNFIKQRDFGYQHQRQTVIQSLIHTEKFEELIGNKEVMAIPSTDQCYQGFSDNVYSRVIPTNEYAANGDFIIDIHQVGKVASTSIWNLLTNTFNNKDKHAFVYHTHTININSLSFSIKKANEPILHFSKTYSDIFQTSKEQFQWKFISLVRDPIEIGVSNIFQMLTTGLKYAGLINEHGITDYSIFKENIVNVIKSYILPYWDKEYRENKILDVFSTPFDKEKGFKIIQSDNVEVLILVYERVNEIFPEAMEEFLGIPDLSIPRKNITNEKKDLVSKNYDKIKKELKFDKGTLDCIYAHPFVTHFYNENDIAKMRERWEEPESTFSVSTNRQ